jgi:hypothetical protein
MICFFNEKKYFSIFFSIALHPSLYIILLGLKFSVCIAAAPFFGKVRFKTLSSSD